MFKLHPAFEEPENEDIKIWRFLDFSKLVSVIDSRKLFFSRADKMLDTFEGSIPRKNFDEREKKISDYRGYYEYGPEWHKNQSRYKALNCWHENEHESAAMWNLYLKTNEGIAIQTTYKRLKESLTDNETVYLGR